MTADTGRRTRELEDRMQLGIVGLGRMGANMARRLIKGGHEIVGYAADPAGVKAIGSEGGTGTTTLDDFVKALRPPRVAWVMVPAGAATEQVVTDLAKRMSPGDTIVDGGNSFYKDDVRRMKMLRPQQIHYVDVGTSGGVSRRSSRRSPLGWAAFRAHRDARPSAGVPSRATSTAVRRAPAIS